MSDLKVMRASGVHLSMILKITLLFTQRTDPVRSESLLTFIQRKKALDIAILPEHQLQAIDAIIKSH